MDVVYRNKCNGKLIFRKDMKWWELILLKLGFYKKRVTGQITRIDTSKWKARTKLYVDPNVVDGLTEQ